jgi:hypothetical protein
MSFSKSREAFIKLLGETINLRYEKKGLFFQIIPNFLGFRLKNWNMS